MTLHVCLYQIGRCFTFWDMFRFSGDKILESPGKQCNSLQHREIYEGRTGLYNVVYRSDQDLQDFSSADSGAGASSRDTFSVTRQTLPQKE